MAEIWDQDQKKWIKQLWLNYKSSAAGENLGGRVSEMVGLFGEEITLLAEDRREAVPVGTDCTLSPVKRLVCSPDLPVFSLPANNIEEAAVDSSTSAPERQFTCSFCNKTFTQKNTYQNHLRSHGKEGEDPYQCNFCGKTFAVPARLTRHYRTHTGEKPYQCEYCNKSFSVKENLSVHRRIHTKERPYKCDICDRAFEHSGKLHRHMRIHTGERPHKCSLCAKTFIQSGQLVIHMRTHTGEKPYVCKSCGKGFTCSKQLKVHNRTHTGEKPYSCDICGKSFGYNHVLKLHQVAHYGEKVYKCTICHETFTSKKTMEGHIKSHSEPASNAAVRSGAEGELSSSSDKENKTENETETQSSESVTELISVSTASVVPTVSTVQTVQTVHTVQTQPIQQSPPSSSTATTSPSTSTSTSTSNWQQSPQPHFKDLCQYLQCQNPISGLNPALLAAAAVASASENRTNESDEDSKRFWLNYCQNEPVSSSSRNPSPLPSVETLPVTEPSVYLIPDSLASMHRSNLPNNFKLPTPPSYFKESAAPILINLQSRDLSPLNSSSLTIVPSSSPDPVDLRSCKEELSLPPRKRSKMILKSMESAEVEISSVRYNSVIHYAKAS